MWRQAKELGACCQTSAPFSPGCSSSTCILPRTSAHMFGNPTNPFCIFVLSTISIRTHHSPTRPDTPRMGKYSSIQHHLNRARQHRHFNAPASVSPRDTRGSCHCADVGGPIALAACRGMLILRMIHGNDSRHCKDCSHRSIRDVESAVGPPAFWGGIAAAVCDTCGSLRFIKNAISMGTLGLHDFFASLLFPAALRRCSHVQHRGRCRRLSLPKHFTIRKHWCAGRRYGPRMLTSYRPSVSWLQRGRGLEACLLGRVAASGRHETVTPQSSM